ncbi:MAG: hypothetical protein LBJ78_00055 [Puniceicoccales bacterium]|jgi:hypothetical protein|nr:hypothetical protein [Puniceicoccales bacterium]
MQVQRTEADPIYLFLKSTLTYWRNNVYTYVDRDSLPGTPIHPLGWYQIELLLLKNKLRTMVTLRGETQHPLLLLLAVKSRALERILKANQAEEENLALMRGERIWERVSEEVRENF